MTAKPSPMANAPQSMPAPHYRSPSRVLLGFAAMLLALILYGFFAR